MWAQWDDDFVLYHRLSGQTHFVNALTARLLGQLLQRPGDVAAVLREFGAEEAGNASAAATNQIVGLLRRLEELGLIRRVGALDEC